MRLTIQGKKFITNLTADNKYHLLRFYAVADRNGMQFAADIDTPIHTDIIMEVEGLHVALSPKLLPVLKDKIIHSETVNGITGIVLLDEEHAHLTI
ncbi:hypothetical protein ACIQ4I_00965 [Rummeliibacillus sp. NPDC094406]|uniref:hypothetical protein n=1 Tax=Rummeliibacillus TaxID=648802 RepID=UPI0037CAE02E